MTKYNISDILYNNIDARHYLIEDIRNTPIEKRNKFRKHVTNDPHYCVRCLEDDVTFEWLTDYIDFRTDFKVVA